MAGIQFHLADRIARSPFKAPFGSVESSQQINPTLLYRFLEYIEGQLKAQGVSEIYLKNPPRAYALEKWSLLETFFLNQKYVVCEAEVGTVIPVTQQMFSEGIRHSEKLRMQQAEKAGFTFQILCVDKLPEVYNFISECHREKGYTVSMTQQELQRTVEEFPDRYLLFSVYHERKIVAASIAIRIDQSKLYNFLSNHEKQYNNSSPSLLLMEGIYEYCCQHKIELFDLGTSALQGIPNFTLLDFKLRIGGIPTSKLSFYKKIS